MPVLRVDFAHTAKIQSHRDHILFHLSESEYEEVQKAIKQKWIFMLGNVHKKKNLLLDKVYWTWCRETETPFVKVVQATSRSSKCECHLDVYTTDYDLSDEGLDKVEELFQQNGNFRRMRKDSRQYELGNWNVCEHIPVEKASYVATQLLNIANTYRKIHTIVGR